MRSPASPGWRPTAGSGIPSDAVRPNPHFARQFLDERSGGVDDEGRLPVDAAHPFREDASTTRSDRVLPLSDRVGLFAA